MPDLELTNAQSSPAPRITVEQPDGAWAIGLTPAEIACMAANRGRSADENPRVVRANMVRDTCRSLALGARAGRSDADLHQLYHQSVQDLLDHRRLTIEDAPAFRDAVVERLHGGRRAILMRAPYLARALPLASGTLGLSALATIFAVTTRAFHHSGESRYAAFPTDLALGAAATALYSASGGLGYASYHAIRDVHQERSVGHTLGRLASRISEPMVHVVEKRIMLSTSNPPCHCAYIASGARTEPGRP